MLNGACIMIIELLDKSTLVLMNKKLKYPLAIYYFEELADESVEVQLKRLPFTEISN